MKNMLLYLKILADRINHGGMITVIPSESLTLRVEWCLGVGAVKLHRFERVFDLPLVFYGRFEVEEFSDLAIGRFFQSLNHQITQSPDDSVESDI